MASNLLPTSFNGTCVPIEYKCTPGSLYVDPCDCTLYYECVHGTSIISRMCGPGTAYDHTSSSSVCISWEDIVYGHICDQSRPWARCKNVSGYQNVDEDKLKRWCTSAGDSTSAPQEQGGDGGGNAGAIVGAVFAILIIIAVVALVVIYVRRKGNPIPHIQQTRFWREVILREGRGNDGSNANSRYSTSRYGDTPSVQEHGDEETYAEIDDTAMYKDPSAQQKPPLRHSSSHTNETYDREDEGEGVAYDNPALQRDTPPPDTELSPAPSVYSSLDDRGETPRSYSSLSEHHRAREVNEMDSVKPAPGDSGYLMAEPMGRLQRGPSPTDPSYFELEQQENGDDGYRMADPTGQSQRGPSPTDPPYFELENQENALDKGSAVVN